MIISGSYFNGSTISQYENHVLSCNDNNDCSIKCLEKDSCYNATILCPINGACNVTCLGGSSCDYADIHWIEGNINSLSCDTSFQTGGVCDKVRHPPSISDTTPLSITCSSWECKGQIITCPDNAPCRVTCSGSFSCQSAIINCPSSSDCDIQCIGMHFLNIYK